MLVRLDQTLKSKEIELNHDRNARNFVCSFVLQFTVQLFADHAVALQLDGCRFISMIQHTPRRYWVPGMHDQLCQDTQLFY